MAVFTHTVGGLMYEASVGGQKFSFGTHEPTATPAPTPTPAQETAKTE